ncbi:unnamed protein product [Moneuplotes crassus]|uniref:Uncharacterized protein n=1 Tax=Euplotes crassus TaxID=5936 RepID=A0AAD1UD60_EUPCR|nr:unnamed protein product [Moneuplotes crassus]
MEHTDTIQELYETSRRSSWSASPTRCEHQESRSSASNAKKCIFQNLRASKWMAHISALQCHMFSLEASMRRLPCSRDFNYEPKIHEFRIYKKTGSRAAGSKDAITYPKFYTTSEAAEELKSRGSKPISKLDKMMKTLSLTISMTKTRQPHKRTIITM